MTNKCKRRSPWMQHTGKNRCAISGTSVTTCICQKYLQMPSSDWQKNILQCKGGQRRKLNCLSKCELRVAHSNNMNLATDCRNMYNNGIREIHDHAFNGTKIDKLYIPFPFSVWIMSSWLILCQVSSSNIVNLCSVTFHDFRVLKNNRKLRVIRRDAFKGATGPGVL